MKKSFPNTRLRRLRSTKSLRNLIRENSLSPHDLIQPIFLIEGKNKTEKIKTMPDIFRFSIDKAIIEIKKLKNLGIESVALFPCINKKYKDLTGTESYNPDGLIQRAISEIKLKIADITIISDVALDPYTSHGQDGVISKKGKILNDETIEVLIKQALSHAKCGVDIIAPSDMMDGRIKKIRQTLEKNSYHNTILLSYSAKYSSNFYGPFRDAVGSAKNLGSSNKDTYQMDYSNQKDAINEVELDINEGADIVMVKPSLPYLDIICRISQKFNIPIFAYQVSGEYSMIKSVAKNNSLDEKKIVLETLTCIKRAGANAIITYFAKDALKWMK
tara:strand:- start:228 stop:1220 length:993 start_codon:yes stop_codon:yes gene_type:complete